MIRAWWQMTYETTQPWVVYEFGRTHDLWWPFWNSTRWLGYARIGMRCAVCGVHEVVKIKMPRTGEVPDKGHHRERLRFLLAHVHRERPHPMSWAQPLLNPAVHPEGIDLDLLAMRLEADLKESR